MYFNFQLLVFQLLHNSVCHRAWYSTRRFADYTARQDNANYTVSSNFLTYW